MRNINVTCISVDTEKLIINTNEAAMRLKIPRGYKDDRIDSCASELKKVLICKFAFLKVPVAFDGNYCNVGFGNTESRGLSKALYGCEEAFLAAATLGLGADRLISRLALVSKAESFITDALASAFAEALIEYADSFLRGNEEKPMRFSPGYGDLPLSVQPQLLSMLDAGQTLGITLNSALLMTPMKSITAIMGIGGQQ